MMSDTVVLLLSEVLLAARHHREAIAVEEELKQKLNIARTYANKTKMEYIDREDALLRKIRNP